MNFYLEKQKKKQKKYIRIFESADLDISIKNFDFDDTTSTTYSRNCQI